MFVRGEEAKLIRANMCSCFFFPFLCSYATIFLSVALCLYIFTYARAVQVRAFLLVCVCVFVIVSFFSCTLSFQPTTHTICEWDFSSTDLLFIQYYDYIIRIYEEDLHIKKKNNSKRGQSKSNNNNIGK